jgi:hypothetical protein
MPPRKKQKRNITGLRNQQQTSSAPSIGYSQQYWGWCKYQYREVDKSGGFKVAKETAIRYLDACPPEVIRRFINRSWRFMSAYRHGLTGKAADWAVRRQKAHRTITEAGMKALEAVVVRK